MLNGLIVDKLGTKRYYLNDLLHREDGPAIEMIDGSKYWYLNDEQHREDGPAIIWADGNKFWLMHGKKHRVDGPAIQFTNGSLLWFLNGEKHRVDGPADEWSDGSTFWYLNGKELIHPKEYKNMKEFIEKLNSDEKYSLQWINDFNCLIEMINNPTAKQKRLNAMKWKL